MIVPLRGAAAAFVLLSTALDAQQAANLVQVDAATRQRLGIETAMPSARNLRSTIESPARVLDPTPLAELDAALAELAAGLATDRAEAERTARLFAEDTNVSARARDEAAARLAGDEARDAALRRRLALEWGPGLAALDDSTRARLLTAVARGERALVRVELARGVPASPREIELAPVGDPVHGAVGSVLGALPTVDPQFQTPGLLVSTRSAPGELPAGRVLVARLPTGQGDESGVVLPRSALLRRDGSLWAYVAVGEEGFERRPVVDARPVADGYFVASGFGPGDRVVVTGAADLFAVEHAASVESAPPADDDD